MRQKGGKCWKKIIKKQITPLPGVATKIFALLKFCWFFKGNKREQVREENRTSLLRYLLNR